MADPTEAGLLEASLHATDAEGGGGDMPVGPDFGSIPLTEFPLDGATADLAKELFAREVSEGDLPARLAELDGGDVVQLLTALYRRYRVVHDLQQAINNISSTGFSIEEALARIMDGAHRIVNSDRVTLFTVSAETGMMCLALSNSSAKEGVRFPIGKGIAGTVAKTGRTIICTDAYDDDRFDRTLDALTNYRTKTVLCMPVRDDRGVVIAVIQAINKLDGTPYSSVDTELLGSIAACAGSELRKLQLYNDTVRANAVNSEMLRLTKRLAAEADLSRVVETLLHGGGKLVLAESVALWHVDRRTRQLHLIAVSDGEVTVNSERDRGSIIPLDVGILGNAASAAKSVIYDGSDDATGFVADHDNCPTHAFPTRATQSLLCVPVIDPDGHIMAMLAAYNKLDADSRRPRRHVVDDEGAVAAVDEPELPPITTFTARDQSLLESVAASAGTSMHKLQLLNKALAARRKNQALLQVVKAVSVDTDFISLVTGVVDAIYIIMCCDRVNLFLHNPAKEELWRAVAKDAYSGDRSPAYTLRTGEGFVGSCFDSGETLLVVDARSDPRFISEVDEVNEDVPTKSVLCMPVRDMRGKLVAVVEVINKRAFVHRSIERHRLSMSLSSMLLGDVTRQNFTKEDELLLAACCTEIGLTLQRKSMELLLYSKAGTDSEEVSSFLGTYKKKHSIVARTASEDLERLRRSSLLDSAPAVKVTKEEVQRWDFSVFDLSPANMLILAMQFFTEFNLPSVMELDEDELSGMLAAVLSLYRDNPFHNAHHGFATMHAVYLFLVHTEAPSYLTFLDTTAMFVAALAHDVDHPAVTNSFLINSSDELALTYNDISVLENHHARTLFSMLSDRGMTIFNRLPEDQYPHFRRIVIDCILSTDMTKHFDMCNHLKGLPAAEPFSKEDESNRQVLVNTIVHCADLSGQVYHRRVALRWTEAITNEFHRQAKQEGDLGLPLTPYMCGLDKPAVSNKLQHEFCLFVVMPLWTAVAELFPPLQVCVDTLRGNAQYYKDTSAIGTVEEEDDDDDAEDELLAEAEADAKAASE
eukprot:PLAT4950.1.p1 GENE.PLAT4950.1~~PLAT4950.1.p1  ORF type:complete len:1050 (-),score=476.69 PLAT4950.1:90-3218(-)